MMSLLLAGSAIFGILSAWLFARNAVDFESRPGVTGTQSTAAHPYTYGSAAFSAAVAVGGFTVLFALFGAVSSPLVVNTAFALGLVMITYFLLNTRTAVWAILCIFMLAVMVPQFESNWATYWHGFMHSSIVYEIYERGMPPENPLMVGEPLRYMYGHHALIAWLMQAVPMTPTHGFILTNAVGLIIVAWAIDRIASEISTNRRFRLFAVLLALLGFTPLVMGPLQEPIGDFIADALGTRFESRYMPLRKFLGINNNQTGLVFFALSLLSLVRLVVGKTAGWRAYLLLALSSVGSGLMYPPAWLGIAASAGTVGCYFVSRNDQRLRQCGLGVLGVVAASSIIVIPMTLSLTSGKSGTSAIELISSKGFKANVYTHGLNLVMFLLLPIALAWYARATLVANWRKCPHFYAVLLLSAVITQAMYFAIKVPDQSEYKFLGFSVFALAVLVAIAMEDIQRRNPFTGVLLLSAIILSSAPRMSHMLFKEEVSDPVYGDGRFLRHRDEAQDALYRWIATSTPVDAVFIDTYLTVPALGRRQLLIGLDTRRESLEIGRGVHDGWLVKADDFLNANTGVNQARLTRLRSIAQAFVGRHTFIDRNVLDELARSTFSRPVFVVARSAAVRAKLDGLAGLEPVFAGDAAWVFKQQIQ